MRINLNDLMVQSCVHRGRHLNRYDVGLVGIVDVQFLVSVRLGGDLSRSRDSNERDHGSYYTSDAPHRDLRTLAESPHVRDGSYPRH
jgi:hypothetical protein